MKLRKSLSWKMKAPPYLKTNSPYSKSKGLLTRQKSTHWIDRCQLTQGDKIGHAQMVCRSNPNHLHTFIVISCSCNRATSFQTLLFMSLGWLLENKSDGFLFLFCFVLNVGQKQETLPAMKRPRRWALHHVRRDRSQLTVNNTPAHTLTESHFASRLIRL